MIFLGIVATAANLALYEMTHGAVFLVAAIGGGICLLALVVTSE